MKTFIPGIRLILPYLYSSSNRWFSRSKSDAILVVGEVKNFAWSKLFGEAGSLAKSTDFGVNVSCFDIGVDLTSVLLPCIILCCASSNFYSKASRQASVYKSGGTNRL